jgi:spermidine synthase
MATYRGSADVLIVDGFDVNGQVSSLCSQAFYDDCFAALRPGGVFVANLLICDENADIYLRRIQGSFGDRVLILPLREDDNLVVFAFENARPMARMNELFDRAEALKVMYGLAFPVFVDAMTCASSFELAP